MPCMSDRPVLPCRHVDAGVVPCGNVSHGAKRTGQHQLRDLPCRQVLHRGDDHAGALFGGPVLGVCWSHIASCLPAVPPRHPLQHRRHDRPHKLFSWHVPRHSGSHSGFLHRMRGWQVLSGSVGHTHRVSCWNIQHSKLNSSEQLPGLWCGEVLPFGAGDQLHRRQVQPCDKGCRRIGVLAVPLRSLLRRRHAYSCTMRSRKVPEHHWSCRGE